MSIYISWNVSPDLNLLAITNNTQWGNNKKKPFLLEDEINVTMSSIADNLIHPFDCLIHA